MIGFNIRRRSLNYMWSNKFIISDNNIYFSCILLLKDTGIPYVHVLTGIINNPIY
jgi:hypothetical protein